MSIDSGSINAAQCPVRSACLTQQRDVNCNRAPTQRSLLKLTTWSNQNRAVFVQRVVKIATSLSVSEVSEISYSGESGGGSIRTTPSPARVAVTQVTKYQRGGKAIGIRETGHIQNGGDCTISQLNPQIGMPSVGLIINAVNNG